MKKVILAAISIAVLVLGTIIFVSCDNDDFNDSLDILVTETLVSLKRGISVEENQVNGRFAL